ncbi:hypothetical protein EDB85DRAFT_2021022 [Lactarius pseudohatsudake]|nr:hypothetical protein EDB85DRAFT_2021022 [Lactarius pseudohatsudake]
MHNFARCGSMRDRFRPPVTQWVLTISLPDLAAPTRSFSPSSSTLSRHRWPPIRNFMPRGGVRDRFRPPAGLHPPPPSLTAPHPHAALALEHRSFNDHRRPMYDTARSAEACTTASERHPRPPHQWLWQGWCDNDNNKGHAIDTPEVPPRSRPRPP